MFGLFGKNKKDKYTTGYLESLASDSENITFFPFFDEKMLDEEEEGIEELKEAGEAEETGTVEERYPVEDVPLHTLEQKKEYVSACCERIVEADKRIEELKVEYRAVNNYLSDITKIENLPDAEAASVLDYAKRVIVLEKDRKDFGRSMSKLTDKQYRHMREIEPEIKDILRQMSEEEKRCETIKTDMKYLEGERMTLILERKDMKQRLENIRKTSILSTVAFASAFVLLLILAFNGYGSATYWMYGLVACAAVYVFAAFLMFENATIRLREDERKLNRAILLLNKRKIKYVNVVNTLEYMYEKHGVKSAFQLNKVWGAFIRLKKEQEVYNKASARLLEAEDGLVDTLKKMGIKDYNIWVNQAYAIIDAREMEELKQSLNHRRMKLKRSLDYNRDSIQAAKADIKRVVLAERKHAEELMKIVDGIDENS